MELTKQFLEELRTYEIDKFEEEQSLREKLDRLVTTKFNGSFSTFMKEAVLNEDYGSLKSEVERLYMN